MIFVIKINVRVVQTALLLVNVEAGKKDLCDRWAQEQRKSFSRGCRLPKVVESRPQVGRRQGTQINQRK